MNRPNEPSQWSALSGTQYLGRLIWDDVSGTGLRPVLSVNGDVVVREVARPDRRRGAAAVQHEPHGNLRLLHYARAVRLPDTRGLAAHHVAGDLVWVVGPRGLAALDTRTLSLRGTWRTGPRIEAAADAPAALGFKSLESFR